MLYLMGTKEVWRNVPGYPNKLLVSNFGRVKSNYKLLRGEFVSGYMRVKISDNGVIYREFLHRLVAMAFIVNNECKPCVNHKDGNKLNNVISNLEWVTYGENLKHAFATNLRCSNGEQNPASKLTNNDIETIRKIYDKGKRFGNNANYLAKKYKVSPRCILDIVKYKTWKHVS